MLEIDERNILSLSDEEVERVIDRECAERGVRLLPPVPTPPAPLEASADVEYYTVGGLVFGDEEDAQDVVDIVNRSGDLKTYYLEGTYAYSGPMGVKPSEDPVKVRKEMHWSVAAYEKHRTAIATFREQKKEFDEKKSDYDECFRVRGEVSDEIWDRVRSVRRAEDRRQAKLAEFGQYVDIVGDEETAFACMVKAGRCSPDDRELVGLTLKGDNR